MPWNLTHDDIERIAIGAGILGTGGGGNPYRGMTRARLQLEQGHELQIVGLDELPDDALVVPIGGMGAPTIGLEKIGRGDEGKIAIEELERQLGVKVAATVPVEVGGGNSFTPMIAATQLGLPTVDADGMGRAFPELDMVSYYFDGVAPSPIVMVDCQHRKVVIRDVSDTKMLERMARAMCVQLGGSAMVADCPIPMRRLRETCIPNTLTLAHRIGDAVLTAQHDGNDPVQTICGVTDGRVLFVGKVTDVDRRFERGYNFGRLRIAGLGQWEGRTARIDLQNEFLIVRVEDDVLAIVPDLITLVDSERGNPITTEVVRYGLRVTVLGIPAPLQLTTERALHFVGPQAFGYEESYRPLERREPVGWRA
jgi:uncharacterized protein